MLSSPIKVYEYYSEQSILVAISYFRAQQIPSWTKEVRPFIILLMELFKFILTFDEAQLYAIRLVFAQNSFQAWMCILPLSEPDTIRSTRFS